MEVPNKSIPLISLFAAWLLLASPTLVSASAKRSNYIVHMDKSAMPKIFSNSHHWYSSIVDSVKFASDVLVKKGEHHDNTPPEIIYTYEHVIDGFSVVLSEDELAVLKNTPGFLSSYKDQTVTIDTTYTPKFLSLNPSSGLWKASELGKGVIVGVIDSGVWPESSSFKDDGMPEIPDRWKGICESGQEFNSSLCNKKLIGVRYFNKGLKSEDPGLNISMDSGRDTRGHGTHTSSTVAGNYVENVSLFGYAPGTARGIAPRAHIAIYKVLWDEGRQASDVLAGMDQAVADGVDVISISMGFDILKLYEDPISIASFGAMEKGVFVSSSAGNDRNHNGNLHNGIPWVLTVGAGTTDRWLSGTLTLGNGRTIPGWSMFPANAFVRNFPLIYNKKISSCDSVEALSKSTPTGIIICEDIGNYTTQIGTFLNSDVHIPAAIFISEEHAIFEQSQFFAPSVVISSKDAPYVIDYAQHSPNATVTIEFQQTIFGANPNPSPAVAAYNLRGPSRSYPYILKPDLIAPGTLILAAWIPHQVTGAIWDVGLTSDYYMLSGTSMACPHASGIAALLKSVHPEWSPAAIRSAMITTANPTDNSRSPIKDIGENYEAATPLAMGAGHVDPNSALDPGLIYDVSVQDYINLLCSMNFTRNQILTITRSPNLDCSHASDDLNYPSFIVFNSLGNSNKAFIKTFERSVTNVGEGATRYKASVVAPKGSVVTVYPEELIFEQRDETQRYTLSIHYMGKEDGVVTFGSLVWEEQNGKHNVRSPIVVSHTVPMW
ncbi:serine protease [Lithospermum erythrorhizon]|uniref:Serine protease n=1 Tax=Lithospermum erythrorhizon TaxID=34254 RepID=A0AAV3P3Y5_LITER